jgi:predicted ABC-type ATPase
MSKRMRVFAGPNGSGKSSIIKAILDTKIANNKTLDFGIYVNADDITASLKRNCCNLNDFNINATRDDIITVANGSGLINEQFHLERFKKCIQFKDNKLTIERAIANEIDDCPFDRIAQILADYIRKKLLDNGEKFSFETVFSHESKIEIIKRAKIEGYKVYLYFVSTEDPEINVYRVKIVRVGNKGHDVNEELIRSRYYRSMNFMYDAAQLCYQAYFFDNSNNGNSHSLFAHFKIDRDGKKIWDNVEESLIPIWFKRYYSDKVKK